MAVRALVYRASCSGPVCRRFAAQRRRGVHAVAHAAPTEVEQLELSFVPAAAPAADDSTAAQPALEQRPHDARFELHPSVEFWNSFGTRFSNPLVNMPGPGGSSQQQLAELTATVRELLAPSLADGDAQAAAYWAYHLGRTGWFMGAAAAGVITHHLAVQVQSLLQQAGGSSGGSSSSSSSSSSPGTPFERLASDAASELYNRLLEALAVYRQDLAAVTAGDFKLPWDMATFPRHRQFNPLFAASMAAAFCAEAVSTLNRRMAQGPTGNWLSSSFYPRYYLANTFHYQSDGWLSSSSAQIYEFSTEALFFGRQDAMQRTTLLPLASYLRDRLARGDNVASLRLAEVGCGTGRFHTFIKDNWPTLPTIASDLSPFYLAQARSNVAYWKRLRAPELSLGGTDDTGTSYMQAAMEALPLPDASLDVVCCVYCFHEMPRPARQAAAAEWFRLLKPGGLVVLSDSVQLGDRPVWDPTLGNFSNMNEPHYRDYISCDLGALFEAAGFECGTKHMCSATKTLSFFKPAAPAGEAAGGGTSTSSSSSGAGASGGAGSSNGSSNGSSRGLPTAADAAALN